MIRRRAPRLWRRGTKP